MLDQLYVFLNHLYVLPSKYLNYLYLGLAVLQMRVDARRPSSHRGYATSDRSWCVVMNNLDVRSRN